MIGRVIKSVAKVSVITSSVIILNANVGSYESSGMVLISNDGKFEVYSHDVINEEHLRDERGQKVKVLKNSSGEKALVNQLYWLRDMGGESQIGGDREPLHESALIATLNTENEVQIVLGEEYKNEAYIFRDNLLVGATSGARFQEDGLTPGMIYEYKIQEKGSADISADIDLLPEIESVGINTKLRVAMSIEKESALRGIGDSNQIIQDEVAGSKWMHIIYIPQDKVKVNQFQGLACGGAEAFVGDGRGDILPIDGNIAPHRTAVEVNVNWLAEPHEQVSWKTSVGKTQKIVRGKIVDSKRASSKNIHVENLSSESGAVRFKISHDLGNPFCIGGSAKYKESVQIWRNGSYAVRGVHNHVPNHEIYIRNDYLGGGQNVSKVWNFGEARYSCLIGWIPQCQRRYAAS